MNSRYKNVQLDKSWHIRTHMKLAWVRIVIKNKINYFYLLEDFENYFALFENIFFIKNCFNYIRKRLKVYEVNLLRNNTTEIRHFWYRSKRTLECFFHMKLFRTVSIKITIHFLLIVFCFVLSYIKRRLG